MSWYTTSLVQVSNGPPEALQTGPGPVRTPTKEVSNASRHPSRAAQATLALPAACEPGQLAPASLNRARDCPAPCSYCRQQGRKRAQSAMLASNTASSDLSGCYTTASARLVAGGMPAPRCSELTAPRTRLKAEGRRRLRLAAGERKLRRSPQTWRREPPPAAQRPPPRGSWRWERQRRPAPPPSNARYSVRAGGAMVAD